MIKIYKDKGDPSQRKNFRGSGTKGVRESYG